MSIYIDNSYHSLPQLNLKEKTDIKRIRGQISCAECRRLKMKCDKKIPCSSCVRRGCISVCPTGTSLLASGARLTPSNAVEFYKTIEIMSQRIRQLEDALAILQATVSSDTHPLLKAESLLASNLMSETKSTITNPQVDTIPEDVAEALGTLSLGELGDARYFGRSAGPESLLAHHSVDNTGNTQPASEEDRFSTFSSDISLLVNSFPFAADGTWDVSQAMNILLTYLPNKQRAWSLAAIYLHYDPWSDAFLSPEELKNELLTSVYDYLTDVDYTPGLDIPFSPSRLALLFFCFAHATLADYSLPRYHPDSEVYFDLGRAALALQPILSSPDLSSVQALGLASLFLDYGGPKFNLEGAWSYMTIAVKLAHAIGLHHESSTWDLDERTLHRRRSIYWELFNYDSMLSLAFGRPPSIHLSHGEPLVPDDPNDGVNAQGKKEPGYLRWRMDFCRDVISRVVDIALSPTVPDYQVILDLDKRIRQHPVPEKYDTLRKLSGTVTKDSPVPTDGEPESNYEKLTLPMRSYQITQHRALVNMHIHRVFFARALVHARSQPGSDPLSSTYATSYLAAYRSASTIIHMNANYVHKYPEQILRCWAIWTGVLSAGIIVGLIVTQCPACTLADNAYTELGLAVDLFTIGAAHSSRVKRGLEVLTRLHEKATKVYRSSSHDATKSQEHTNAVQEDVDALHELQLFMGHTKLLMKKTSSAPGGQSNVPTPDRLKPSELLTNTRSYVQSHKNVEPVAPPYPLCMSGAQEMDYGSVNPHFYQSHSQDSSYTSHIPNYAAEQAISVENHRPPSIYTPSQSSYLQPETVSFHQQDPHSNPYPTSIHPPVYQEWHSDPNHSESAHSSPFGWTPIQEQLDDRFQSQRVSEPVVPTQVPQAVSMPMQTGGMDAQWAAFVQDTGVFAAGPVHGQENRSHG